jgi:hypothetical protein
MGVDRACTGALPRSTTGAGGNDGEEQAARIAAATAANAPAHARRGSGICFIEVSWIATLGGDVWQLSYLNAKAFILPTRFTCGLPMLRIDAYNAALP